MGEFSQHEFGYSGIKKKSPFIQLSRVAAAVALAFGLSGDKGSSHFTDPPIGAPTLNSQERTPEEIAALERLYAPKREYHFVESEPLKDSLAEMMHLFKRIMRANSSVTVFAWPDSTRTGDTATYGYADYPNHITARGGGKSGFQVSYHVGSTLQATGLDPAVKEAFPTDNFPMKVAVLDDPSAGLRHVLVGTGRFLHFDKCIYNSPCSIDGLAGAFEIEIGGLQHHQVFKKIIPDR